MDAEALATYILDTIRQHGLDPSKLSLKDMMGHQSWTLLKLYHRHLNLLLNGNIVCFYFNK